MEDATNNPETNDIFELIGISADSPNIVPTEECDDSTEADLLIPCEPPTQVYWNGFGQVVIRQQDWSDADRWILFSLDSVPALIARLQQMLKEGPETSDGL